MKTKRMRGFQWMTGWMLLVARAPGKKWEIGQETSAWSSMFAFIAARSVNVAWQQHIKSKHNRRNGPPSPLRLLGPGGIIVAESHTRQRKQSLTNRKPRKSLVSTAQYRASITIPPGVSSSPVDIAGARRGIGYPFLTMRDPHKPRRT